MWRSLPWEFDRLAGDCAGLSKHPYELDLLEIGYGEGLYLLPVEGQTWNQSREYGSDELPNEHGTGMFPLPLTRAW